MTDILDTMPPAEIERILRPFHRFSLEALGATPAATFDCTVKGHEIGILTRGDLEAVSRLYAHFNPAARYGQLLVKGAATAADRPPAKSILQRVVESRWAWTYYYALGFLGGLCAADFLS